MATPAGPVIDSRSSLSSSVYGGAARRALDHDRAEHASCPAAAGRPAPGRRAGPPRPRPRSVAARRRRTPARAACRPATPGGAPPRADSTGQATRAIRLLPLEQPARSPGCSRCVEAEIAATVGQQAVEVVRALQGVAEAAGRSPPAGPGCAAGRVIRPSSCSAMWLKLSARRPTSSRRPTGSRTARSPCGGRSAAPVTARTGSVSWRESQATSTAPSTQRRSRGRPRSATSWPPRRPPAPAASTVHGCPAAGRPGPHHAVRYDAACAGRRRRGPRAVSARSRAPRRRWTRPCRRGRPPPRRSRRRAAGRVPAGQRGPVDEDAGDRGHGARRRRDRDRVGQRGRRPSGRPGRAAGGGEREPASSGPRPSSVAGTAVGRRRGPGEDGVAAQRSSRSRAGARAPTRSAESAGSPATTASAITRAASPDARGSDCACIAATAAAATSEPLGGLGAQLRGHHDGDDQAGAEEQRQQHDGKDQRQTVAHRHDSSTSPDTAKRHRGMVRPPPLPTGRPRWRTIAA